MDVTFLRIISPPICRRGCVKNETFRINRLRRRTLDVTISTHGLMDVLYPTKLVGGVSKMIHCSVSPHGCRYHGCIFPTSTSHETPNTKRTKLNTRHQTPTTKRALLNMNHETPCSKHEHRPVCQICHTKKTNLTHCYLYGGSRVSYLVDNRGITVWPKNCFTLEIETRGE